MVAAGEQQDEQEHDQGEGDDAGDLDPPWDPRSQTAVRTCFSLGGGGLVRQLADRPELLAKLSG